MAKLNTLFSELVLKVTIIADGIEIRLFNAQQKEQLMLKYNRQDFLVEIDLACKGITSIRALGLEVQSRESLAALELAARNALDNLKWLKELSNTDVHKMPKTLADV
jgi:hypothetical protein